MLQSYNINISLHNEAIFLHQKLPTSHKMFWFTHYLCTTVTETIFSQLQEGTLCVESPYTKGSRTCAKHAPVLCLHCYDCVPRCGAYNK